jgi:hypothetical protein
MFKTYVPNNATEPETRKVKAGSLANRRPRNTCFDCNSGWMEKIETYARPYITNLLLGQPCLLEPIHQYAVAAFLCLVNIRIDISNRIARAIPKEDHEHLMQKREPGSSWRIWIMYYTEGNGRSYEYSHFPMTMKQFRQSELASLTAAEIAGRAEEANTQVTTICIGRLCAHLYSSSVERNFGGYDGAPMTQIWPITGRYIDTHLLPPIDPNNAIWLHETIGRARNPPNFR